MFQHHHAAERERRGVDLVLPGVLGGCPVDGFKDRHAVANVSAVGNPQAAHLCGGGVAQVVAVKVGERQHVVFIGAGEQLLEHVVGDAVFHDDFARRAFPVVFFPQLFFGDGLVAKFFARQFIAPVTEGAFGEFHDVAFVHQGHAGAVALQGVANGLAHQPLGLEFADGLDAHAGGFDVVNVHAHFIAQEREEFHGFGCAGLPFNPGVHIFGGFAEEHHVHLFGVLHWAGQTRDVVNGAHVGVQVEPLTNGDIQAANTAADGRGERPLDTDVEVFKGLQRFVGQPFARFVAGAFTGIDFHPDDFARAVVGLFDGGIQNALHGGRHVCADAVAHDEGDDGFVRDDQAVAFPRNAFTFTWNGKCFEVHSASSIAVML